jgi:hypothetical protein
MNGTECQRRLDRQGVFWSVKNMDVFPAASMGATHASHGLAREGQPWAVSRRSLRNRIYGGPENTLSIEASRAQAPPVHE